MSVPGKKSVKKIGLLLLVLSIGGLFGANEEDRWSVFNFQIGNARAESMLPQGVAIEDGFTLGFGAPVGEVELVQGDVFLIHEKTRIGYRAKDALPLFEGDTIVTEKRGRIRLKLKDGSILTLASQTKLVISRSLYNTEKKSRSSFLGMDLGKARFWVKKLLNFKLSEFRVKTKTAVIGVRGSDFIILADEDRTEVTALERTELEVVSLAGPEAEPSLVTDFERIVIEESALPSDAEELFIEDIDVMKRDFSITPESMEPEAQRAPELKPQKSEFRVPVEKEMPEPLADKRIRVSDDELIHPSKLREPDKDEPERLGMMSVLLEKEEKNREAEAVLERQEEISKNQHEVVAEEIRKTLPPFPNEPE